MKAKNNFKISTVIQRFLPTLEQRRTLSGHQRSTLKLMSLCKTAALGGHKEKCDQCGFKRIHYNSCGNRNCPSCQGFKKEKWVFDRQFDLLPVKYFHGVFTIPSELHPYFRYNKRKLYDLLMRSVKDTLSTFGFDPKQGINGKIGAILLLHTWTQQLTYHPHVHCIVAAGGLQKNGNWKHSKSNGNFLFPVKAMSKLFRGKLMAGIHQFHKNKELRMSTSMKADYFAVKNKLYSKEWNVYAKKAFGGPAFVMEYLGRYTHKICISNYRILNVSETHVSFRFTDRKICKTKTKSIPVEDFLGLFAEHILPKRFVKIRHIGFLASRSKSKDLAIVRTSLGASPSQPKPKTKMTAREFIKLTTGKDPHQCPCCNKGEMVVTAPIPRIRGSPRRIYSKFITKYRKAQLKRSLV